MAWLWLQSKSAQVNGGTTLAVTYASNLTSGTKLIAALTFVAISGDSVSFVKDGAGNSFTQLASIGLNNSTSTGTLSLWAIDTPAGDAGTAPTITATFSGNNAGASLIIQEVSGLLAGNTTAMIDGTPGTNAGTLTGTQNQALTSPSYTSTAANEYLAALYGDDAVTGLDTYGVPAGYTGDAGNVNSSANADCGVAYANSSSVSETGGYTANTTSNRANHYAQILCAFQIAPAQVGVQQPVITGQWW